MCQTELRSEPTIRYVAIGTIQARLVEHPFPGMPWL